MSLDPEAAKHSVVVMSSIKIDIPIGALIRER
jgi:hypothetical protein